MSRTEPTTISANNDADADDFKAELLALIPFLRAAMVRNGFEVH